MPRYSVLLPTRNGASLLEGCIGSVLDQPYDDVELIVSNNASDDRTAEILDRHAADPRLTTITQERTLGVTENWNAALAASSGNWIVLIGDDDVLLPGFFRRADELMEHHGHPEVLLYNGYAFAFPGFADVGVSQYADPFYVADGPIPADGELSKTVRHELVADLFRFAFSMHLNMQTAVVTRTAVDRLPDGLFRPPFPDFYALSALMLTAHRWVMSSEQLVVVGISPKSFGRTVNSASSVEKARDYLGNDVRFHGHLPGSEIMNGHYETMLALKSDFPDALAGIELDRGEYAWQQAYSWYVQRRHGSLSNRDVLRRLRMLEARDYKHLARRLVGGLRPATIRRWLPLGREAGTAALWPGMRPIPEVSDIAQFAAWIETQRDRTATRA
jgi:glycosyltransferase involved in cell wall biosynthesis